MSTDIARKPESKELAITDEVLKNFLFANDTSITDREQASFFQIAKAFNLNPFKREIYCIAYGKGDKRKLSIVTGYEVYIKRAERSGQLDGWKVEFFGKFEKQRISKEMNGQNGPYTKVTEQVVELERCYARITIHRKDRGVPFEHEVEFAEYTQNNDMWNSKPVTMLKKVAIGQGFRLCFSDELSGMPYLAEEIGHNEEPRTPEYHVQPPASATAAQAAAAMANAQKLEASDDQKRAAFLDAIKAAGVRIGFERIIEVVNSHGYDDPEAVQIKDYRPIINAIKELEAAPQN